MPPKQKPLTRKGEPSQTTEKGLEIPIPERSELMGVLGKAIRKRSASEPRPRGKRQSSQDQ